MKYLKKFESNFDSGDNYNELKDYVYKFIIFAKEINFSNSEFKPITPFLIKFLQPINTDEFVALYRRRI